MKSKRIVVVATTGLLSLGLAAVPVTAAQADPAPVAERGSAAKAEVKAAWIALKAAVRAANQQFVVTVHDAQVAFRAATTEQRASLIAVLTDPTATREQKTAALIQFQSDTAEQREARRAAIKAAALDRQAARKAAWQEFRAAVA